MRKGPIPKPALDRFVTRVQHLETGCWLWLGFICKTTGYGMMYYEGRPTAVHRVAYQEFRKRLLPGFEPDHLCRNRWCANPFHLEAVTHRINCRRGNGASAVNAKRTHCLNGHPCDQENTYWTSAGLRQCKACRKKRQRDFFLTNGYWAGSRSKKSRK